MKLKSKKPLMLLNWFLGCSEKLKISLTFQTKYKIKEK